MTDKHAGFVRRPSLRAMEMREALELIAAPMRPDGTWNRDRAACQELAAEALGRYDDDQKTPQRPHATTRTEIDDGNADIRGDMELQPHCARRLD